MNELEEMFRSENLIGKSEFKRIFRKYLNEGEVLLMINKKHLKRGKHNMYGYIYPFCRKIINGYMYIDVNRENADKIFKFSALIHKLNKTLRAPLTKSTQVLVEESFLYSVKRGAVFFAISTKYDYEIVKYLIKKYNLSYKQMQNRETKDIVTVLSGWVDYRFDYDDELERLEREYTTRFEYDEDDE